MADAPVIEYADATHSTLERLPAATIRFPNGTLVPWPISDPADCGYSEDYCSYDLSDDDACDDGALAHESKSPPPPQCQQQQKDRDEKEWRDFWSE